MKMTKRISILLLLFCLIIFVACEGKDDQPVVIDWDSKIVSMVTLEQESFEKSYEYDEFLLSDLLLHLEYTDGMSRNISVEEDMLNDNDLEKIKKAGNPKITINYLDYEFVSIIHLVDSSLLDKDLNKSGQYLAVIKALRDKETSSISFYIESYADIVSLQFVYSYDANLMQVNNATINPDLKGIGLANIKDGLIQFAYSEGTNLLQGEVLLFTVSYTGDYRDSQLMVSNEFNNVIYVVNSETHQTSMIETTQVLYHTSKK